MKIKRILIFIFLILGLSSMIMLLIKQPNLIPPKAPKTLKDLAYDSDKRLGYTIYIPENGKLEPYLVLTKNYYKQGNVLLIRKYVLEGSFQHNESRKSAYYGESLLDRLMNEVFIQEFPSSLQNQIINTSINVSDKQSVLNHRNSEMLQRKFFLLLEKEIGKDHPVTGNEQEIKYFSADRHKHSIARSKDGSTVLWWLRGVDLHHRLTYAATVMDNGYIDYANVTSKLVLRPSFCLSPDTKIAKEKIRGQELYVLKEFQAQNYPRADLMAEDIGLTGHDLERYYEKYLYYGMEVDIKNPQYGGVLSDSLTAPEGGSVQMRAKTFSDGQFDGWYLKDNLISRDKTLTYQLMQNEKVVAKFSASNGAENEN